MFAISAQLATGRVNALKSKGASRSRTSRFNRATVAMAGAGKKPNDDDKPKGFPRFVTRARTVSLE